LLFVDEFIIFNMAMEFATNPERVMTPDQWLMSQCLGVFYL